MVDVLSSDDMLIVIPTAYVWGYLLHYTWNFVQRHDWGEVRYITLLQITKFHGECDIEIILKIGQLTGRVLFGGCFLANPVAIWTHRTQDKKAALISINITTSVISFNSLTLLNEVESSGFHIQCAWHCSKRSAASQSFVVVERQFFGAIGGEAPPPS